MTVRAPAEQRRTRPTGRVVLLVGLSALIYGAGANIGAGTVLLLAAGMLVTTVWSVTGFLRRGSDLRVVLEPELTLPEGRSGIPVTVAVPRGVIGVVRLRPVLASDDAATLLAGLGTPPADHRPTDQLWSALPRSGTSATVRLDVVLARGTEQRLRVDVDTTDLFGLVQRRSSLTGPVVDVVPARGAAAAFAADSIEGTDDAWIAHALAASGPPATELRPWRPGEPVRAVHWAASERVDRLLLRPRGPETSQRRTLEIEDRPWSRTELDARCRDLAATADRLVQAGVDVEVLAVGRALPWGGEARRLLASLQPNAATVRVDDAGRGR